MDMGTSHPLRSVLARVAAVTILIVATGLLSVATLKHQAPKSLAPADKLPMTRNLIKTSYLPGKLTVFENGLRLSQGLKSRIIARAGSPVQYDTGGQSEIVAHVNPDYGATFPDPRAINKGGWIYVSNSENRALGTGGVGAFTFNKKGKLIEFKNILNNSTANCGGGSTSWGSYISCEETPNGRNYQIDPAGRRSPQIITMGLETNGGQFESFASYTADLSAPQFFVTEDARTGVVRRFIPDSPDWDQPWDMLTGPGMVDYLMVDPSTMTFSWTADVAAARLNAAANFPNTEGIDRDQSTLYFVTKRFKSMFILDLEAGTYRNITTVDGPFEGEPDQVITLLGKTPNDYADLGWLYFTEDGGTDAGIFAKNNLGEQKTIAEFVDPAAEDETTGLAFSPDGSRLYFAAQRAGITYEIWRLDGRTFQAKTFNLNYHSTMKE